MPSTQVPVTGHGPLSFTDSGGAQRVVPLSALVLSESKLAIEPTQWKALFGAGQPFSLADETTLLAVAADRLAAGELLPPPLSPPAPAISFQASAPGAAGNDIAVTVSAGSGTVFTAQVSITASETDTYKGLTGAPAARAAIGVDQVTNPGDVVGSGLVMVKGSGANEEKGLPKDGQTLTVTGNADVVAEDGKTVLFTLVPRANVPAAGVSVSIATDTTAKTFTLTASFQAAKATTKMYPFGPFKPDLLWLVTPSTPAAAVPAAGPQTVQLSGGAPGIAASATAYTS